MANRQTLISLNCLILYCTSVQGLKSYCIIFNLGKCFRSSLSSNGPNIILYKCTGPKELLYYFQTNVLFGVLCELIYQLVQDNFTNIFQRSSRGDRAEDALPSIKDGTEDVPPTKKKSIIEQNHSLLEPTVKVWVEELDLKTEPLNEDPEESQYQKIYNENPIEVDETKINPEDNNTSFQETSAFVSLKKVQDIPEEVEQAHQKKKKNKKYKEESWDMSDIFVTPEKKKKMKSERPGMDQILSDIVTPEKKKKKKKSERPDMDQIFSDIITPEKKKKMKSERPDMDQILSDIVTPEKKKKKKKSERPDMDQILSDIVTPEKKKKKKKSKRPDMDQILSDIVESEKKRKADNEDEVSSKKKKKYGNHHDVNILEPGRVENESEPQQILINNLLSSISESVSSPKKKKKESRRQDENMIEKSDVEETSLKNKEEELSSSQVKKKKEKKKHKKNED